MSTPTLRQRIKVPTRMVQGGFEFKFETDSYDVKLHGLLSPEEYTDVIDRVNQYIKPARSNQIDGALLITGPLLVPLALWGARHSLQTRKRKRLLQQAITDFNETHPDLLMRWNRGGPESYLSIERRPQQQQPEQAAAAALVPAVPQQQQQQYQGALIPATPASPAQINPLVSPPPQQQHQSPTPPIIPTAATTNHPQQAVSLANPNNNRMVMAEAKLVV